MAGIGYAPCRTTVAEDIERGIDSLSDDQQLLFYFALAAAVFDLERKAVAKSIKGFHADALRVPALSIFAIEEPENHLSPYYLSRIISQVRSLIDTNSAQALVTGHSPAVLSRVEPEEVRYCRSDSKTRETTVRSIKLPEDDEEASKFVREAVLAFPELYFARFVLLVEGDSEQIVMPKLAAAFATCAFKALRLTCKSLTVLAHGRHSIESCKCLRQDARNRK